MVSVISKDSLLWDFLIQRDIIQVFVFPEFTGNPCLNGIVSVVFSGHSLWEKTWPQVSLTLICSVISQEELLLVAIAVQIRGWEGSMGSRAWRHRAVTRFGMGEAPNTTMLCPCAPGSLGMQPLSGCKTPGVDTEDMSGRIWLFKDRLRQVTCQMGMKVLLG